MGRKFWTVRKSLGYHRAAEDTEVPAVIFSEDQRGDSILQERNIEVEEQPNREVNNIHVSQQLSFVQVRQLLDALHFENNGVLNHNT